MRMPKRAPARHRTLVVAIAGALLAACSGDATSPAAGAAGSSLAPPVDASKALVGAIDGVYVFSVDPQKEETLAIGESRLIIPSSAICDLSSTSYGPEYWDRSCRPESGTVIITAYVRNAGTDHPRIDFEPAMRFSPAKSVLLKMKVNTPTASSDWQILYCSTFGTAYCVDESLDDTSLAVRVNNMIVSRRIKHFSGYVVTNNSDAY